MEWQGVSGVHEGHRNSCIGISPTCSTDQSINRPCFSLFHNYFLLSVPFIIELISVWQNEPEQLVFIIAITGEGVG